MTHRTIFNSCMTIWSSCLTWGVRRSVEKSLEQLHVFDVVNINGLFKAHHKPLQDTTHYCSLYWRLSWLHTSEALFITGTHTLIVYKQFFTLPDNMQRSTCCLITVNSRILFGTIWSSCHQATHGVNHEAFFLKQAQASCMDLKQFSANKATGCTMLTSCQDYKWW